jgi:2'-5' RNA ligase
MRRGRERRRALGDDPGASSRRGDAARGSAVAEPGASSRRGDAARGSDVAEPGASSRRGDAARGSASRGGEARGSAVAEPGASSATAHADPRIRLFVALELPAEVRAAVTRWSSAILKTSPGLRAIQPDALHVTLCFLGWQSSSDIEAISRACAVVRGAGAVTLESEDGVWLPPSRPRVLALRLKDVDGRLANIQPAVSDVLQAGGWYTPENRPFLAHLTVARARKNARMRRALLPDAPDLAFTASTVTLFRSRLSPSGARYHPLERVSLR